MRNQEFIDRWVRFPTEEGHASNVWACNFRLYSYSTCICQATIENGRFRFIFNTTKYSPTTSKHQTYLRRALDAHVGGYNIVDNIERNKSRLI